MIQLNLTPNQYETICIALKIADDYIQKNDTMFASEQFEKVYNEVALIDQEAKSKK